MKRKLNVVISSYDSGLIVVTVCGVPLSELYDEKLRNKILEGKR